GSGDDRAGILAWREGAGTGVPDGALLQSNCARREVPWAGRAGCRLATAFREGVPVERPLEFRRRFARVSSTRSGANTICGNWLHGRQAPSNAVSWPCAAVAAGATSAAAHAGSVARAGQLEPHGHERRIHRAPVGQALRRDERAHRVAFALETDR